VRSIQIIRECKIGYEHAITFSGMKLFFLGMQNIFLPCKFFFRHEKNILLGMRDSGMQIFFLACKNFFWAYILTLFRHAKTFFRHAKTFFRHAKTFFRQAVSGDPKFYISPSIIPLNSSITNNHLRKKKYFLVVFESRITFIITFISTT
jgi:hypothetical protein